MATPYARAAKKWLDFKTTLQPLKTPEQIQATHFSAKEVEVHNTPDDAWVVYRGYVYDISGYLSFHPGGTGPLRALLGKDISKVAKAIHPRVQVDEVIDVLRIGICSEELPKCASVSGPRGTIRAESGALSDLPGAIALAQQSHNGLGSEPQPQQTQQTQ